MTRFTVREKCGAGATLFEMDGERIEQVATRAAVKIYGSGCYAQRVTGTGGLSGCFRAYRNISGGGASSVGEQFHIG